MRKNDQGQMESPLAATFAGVQYVQIPVARFGYCDGCAFGDTKSARCGHVQYVRECNGPWIWVKRTPENEVIHIAEKLL